MNIKKTTKKELLQIIEDQDKRIEELKSNYRMIASDLQESGKKAMLLSDTLKEADGKIKTLQLEIIAELKAVTYMIKVSGSGLTHNEKRHLSRKNLEILDAKIDYLIKAIDLKNDGSNLQTKNL